MLLKAWVLLLICRALGTPRNGSSSKLVQDVRHLFRSLRKNLKAKLQAPKKNNLGF